MLIRTVPVLTLLIEDPQGSPPGAHSPPMWGSVGSLSSWQCRDLIYDILGSQLRRQRLSKSVPITGAEGINWVKAWQASRVLRQRDSLRLLLLFHLHSCRALFIIFPLLCIRLQVVSRVSLVIHNPTC